MPVGTGSVAPAFVGTPGLEYKTATAVAGPAETGADSGVIGTDDETGVVEAIVSVTGVVDNDHDIIEPGAYKATLARRRPKGIFSHDWKQWASRTEHVEELMPGDPRLAEYAKKIGKQWPVEAGGLYVRTRYNLNTNEGKSAYENVKFFGDECEWSIGYKVPAGKSTRAKDGVRRIKEVDLFEYSPVLFGAASLSGTLSVKSAAVAGDVEDEPAVDGSVGVEDPDVGVEALAEEVEGAVEEVEDPGVDVAAVALAEVGEVFEALGEAEAVAEALAADTEELGEELGEEDGGGAEVPGPPDEQPADEPADGHGPDGAAQDDEDDEPAEDGGAEDAPAEDDAEHEDDGQDDGQDEGADEGQDEPAGDTEPADEPAEPADEPGGAEGDGAGTEESKGLPPGMKRKPAPKSGSGSRATTPGGKADTWKITNVDELRAAITAFGSASGDKEKIRAHIMKRAFALNRPDLIPDGWKKDGGGKALADELDTKGFKEDEHPRGKDGRFIHLGDTVDLPGGKQGQVTGVDKAKGTVSVRVGSAQRKVKTSDVAVSKLPTAREKPVEVGEHVRVSTAGVTFDGKVVHDPGDRKLHVEDTKKGKVYAVHRGAAERAQVARQQLEDRIAAREKEKAAEKEKGGGSKTPGRTNPFSRDHEKTAPGRVTTATHGSVRPGDMVYDSVSKQWLEVASTARKPATHLRDDPNFHGEDPMYAHLRLKKPSGSGPHSADMGAFPGDEIRVVRRADVRKKKNAGDGWSPEQKILAEVVSSLEGEPYRWQGGAEGKMAHESLDRSPKKNWVELAGQLPAYIQHIAKDLHEEKGMPLGQAIPTAIAAVKKWAAGGGGVTPETRAKAAAAVAEWEKLKAKSHARSAARRAGDAAKKDALDGWTRVKAHLPGSFEQLHDELQAAAAGLLEDGEAPGLVELLGTWPDRVVATRYPLGAGGKAVSFEIPYSVAGDGVELGEPVPVRIAVDHDGVSGDGADLGPFPAMVDEVAAGVKTLLDVADFETKAGKVLSGANATRLKQAVEHLVAVLKVAGIEIGEPDEQEPEEQPPAEQDSTAPSARGENVPAGKCLVDPSVHARAYRILADVHARR